MRTLFFTVVLCMLTSGIYAQKIVIESGNVDFLKNERLVKVNFTYENMLVGKMTEEEYVAKKKGDAEAKNSGGGDAWHQSWVSDRASRFEPKFIELYNKYISEKGGANISTNDNTKYLMTVQTLFTEPGFNVGVARKNSSINARVIFTDLETGNTVAVVSIDRSSANDFMGTDFDVAYRIQESYGKAGRELAKFLIKKLKL